jgi:hypothetical protein
MTFLRPKHTTICSCRDQERRHTQRVHRIVLQEDQVVMPKLACLCKLLHTSEALLLQLPALHGTRYTG